MTTAGSPSPGIRLSAPAYFACVAFVSALGIGVAMVFRPAFAHSIRATLGLEKTPQATAESFYTARVAPVFEEHCVGCHGAHRQKADLRLDSFAAAMRGGKHGPIILAGNLKGSELMARLLLPADDDEAMPPGG